jgi:hypothetical protein
MGKEIVYCEGCGKRLSEDEFARGKAHTVDNRHYCVVCRPIEVPRRDPTPRGTAVPHPSSSSRIPRVKTSRIARPGSGDSRRWLWVGGGVAGVAILVLVALASSGNNSEAPAADLVATPRSSPPTPVPAAVARALAIFRELENFAATCQDPEMVLAKCDAVRQELRATPYETRLKEIEADQRKRKKERDGKRQLDTLKEGIRGIRASDPEYLRNLEVLSMLRTALKIAGPSRGEIESLRVEYENGLDAVAMTAANQVISDARRLAGENNHVEALLRLDEYPETYRGTAHGDQVERVWAEIEGEWRLEGNAPPRDWSDYYRSACADASRDDWRSAEKSFHEGLQQVPAEAPGDDPERRIYASGFYTLALLWASKAQERTGDVKDHAVEKVFQYLEAAFKGGYGRHRCRCHPEGGGWEHLKDEGWLQPHAGDARYGELLAKYGP